jgi:hypothetical protein
MPQPTVLGGGGAARPGRGAQDGRTDVPTVLVVCGNQYLIPHNQMAGADRLRSIPLCVGSPE